jgi:hypothetical protein
MVRFLSLVDAGAVDTVIIAKLDRLTRSVKDLAELLERFTRRGVSLASVADSLDTRSAAGRLVLSIMVSVSQWEREAIGERTRDAMHHKRANGERVGTVPFGYRRDYWPDVGTGESLGARCNGRPGENFIRYGAPDPNESGTLRGLHYSHGMVYKPIRSRRSGAPPFPIRQADAERSHATDYGHIERLGLSAGRGGGEMPTSRYAPHRGHQDGRSGHSREHYAFPSGTHEQSNARTVFAYPHDGEADSGGDTFVEAGA